MSKSSLWPVVDYRSDSGGRIVDVFKIAMFLDRESCLDPGPPIAAIESFLSGPGAGHLGFYVNDDGDTVPLPSNYRRILESYIAEPTKTRNLAELVLVEHESAGPHYELEYLNNPESSSERWPEKKSYIWMSMAQSAVVNAGLEELESFIADLSEILPYSSGYAGPALRYGHSKKLVHRYIHRHPGFDVAATDAVAFDIGDRPLGAYWLNLLGPRLLDCLGGTDALAQRLPASAQLSSCGRGGAMVRLGPAPDVGDVNRNNRLEAYRELAAVFEPLLAVPRIKYFTDRDGALSEDEQRAWHRRFLE